MSIVKKISEQIQILDETLERQSEQIVELQKKVAFLKKANNSLVKENMFLVKENESLKKENQSLKREHENSGVVSPKKELHAKETDRLQVLESIIKMDKDTSILAIQELLEIWDKSNSGGKINSARKKFENVMSFLNKEEVDIIYQHIVDTYGENNISAKMYTMIETLLGSDLLTNEQIEDLLNLWTFNGGPKVKALDGLWGREMFPNVIQKASESEKWSVNIYYNRFDLKKN